MPGCCVVGCSNRSSADQSLKFYSFPGKSYETERRNRWISAIKRLDTDGTPWEPTKNSRVCSAHFAGGKPSNIEGHPAYIPSIFPEQYRKKRKDGRSALSRYERATKRRPSAPSEDLPGPLPPPEPPQYASNSRTSVSTQVNFDESTLNASFEFYASREVDGYSSYCNVVRQPLLVDKKDTSCGTENDLQVCRGGFHGFPSVKKKEDLLKYLTSTTHITFSYILSLLPKNGFRSLSDEDTLLLFLMKLKLGLSFGCLGVFFNVHRSTAMRIFLTLLETISIRTADFIFWPPKHSVQDLLPDSFKGKYQNTRVIIDCTEIKAETPAKIEERIYMYSHYKSAYTFKFLIGITPNGFISFKSKCYGGRCSDSQITNDCGLLKLLEKGDVVLADKGFPGVNTSDPDTIIIMPPLLHDGRHTAEEVAKTQSIAGVRIHVERSIQRVKIFLILKLIPHNLFKYVDRIVHVACVLANLLPPMFKEDID